jgi:hypothetical protein
LSFNPVAWCHGYSRSQPGSPPSPFAAAVTEYPEPRRKYSMGSRLSQMRPAAVLSDAELPCPVDLSCKRSKYVEHLMPPQTVRYADNVTGRRHSILHTILSAVPSEASASTVGRDRSHTLSVCGTRGLPGGVWPDGRRQHRVTLAKKTVFPVSSRVAEQLKRAIWFALSLQEFSMLPDSDQLELLAGACPRLLMLYLAESNLQFAVTSVHEDLDSPASGSAEVKSEMMPTMQFVETVQNFIRKCQSLEINASEYYYMRLITLFQAGTCVSVVIFYLLI